MEPSRNARRFSCWYSLVAPIYSASRGGYKALRALLHIRALPLLLNSTALQARRRKQCLDRRIPHIAMLCHEITAWQAARNHNKTKINRRFHTTDARITLKRLYPSASGEGRLPERERMQAA